MAGDQQNMFDAWDRPPAWYRSLGSRAHADVANLGLGQARCDAQRFVEDLLDAGHGGVRVKASASFPVAPTATRLSGRETI